MIRTGVAWQRPLAVVKHGTGADVVVIVNQRGVVVRFETRSRRYQNAGRVIVLAMVGIVEIGAADEGYDLSGLDVLANQGLFVGPVIAHVLQVGSHQLFGLVLQ